MARNLVTVSEVVNDFIMSIDGEDFAKNISDTLVHNCLRHKEDGL